MKNKCACCDNKFNAVKDSDGYYPKTCDICKFKGMMIFFGSILVTVLSCVIFSQLIEYYIILGIGIILIAEWRYLKYKRKPKGFFETIGWKFWEVIQAFTLWWLPAGIIVHTYRNAKYIADGIWYCIINFIPAVSNAISQLISGVLSVGSTILIIIIVCVLFITWAYLNAWLVKRMKK